MATNLSETCHICKKKPTDPVASGCCRTTFCRNCLTGILHRRKPCPKCGNKNPLDKQISKYNVDLDVSCEEEECEWTGEWEELDAHQEICEFIEIECELCEQDVRRKDMSSHLAKDCPDKVELCPKNCGGSFKRKHLDNHLKECGKLPLMVDDLKVKQDHQQQSIDRTESSKYKIKKKQSMTNTLQLQLVS